MKKLLLALALLGLFGSSILISPAQRASAHTGYSSVLTSTYYAQALRFPDFYISNGTTHYVQQTSPYNVTCGHSIYNAATGRSIGYYEVRGSGPNTFGVSNYTGASIKVRHIVQCYSNNWLQIQVYYFHG